MILYSIAWEVEILYYVETYLHWLAVLTFRICLAWSIVAGKVESIYYTATYLHYAVSYYAPSYLHCRLPG